MEASMQNAVKGAPAAFGHERKFDPPRADYLGQVNDIMNRAAAVRYLEVAPSIHPGGEAWKDAYDRAVPAGTFVDRTIDDFGFVRAGASHSAEDARLYNLAKAAMCEFSLGNPEWTRGADGALFNETASGIGIMRPVRERKSGRFGFGIEFREGAELNALKTGLAAQGERTGQFAAMDMSEALETYEASRKVERDFRF